MMDYIKLNLPSHGIYKITSMSNDDMSIIGYFLTDDVGSSCSIWEEWILNDSLGECTSSNITHLEKEGDYVYFSDLYDYGIPKTKLKIPRKSLADLLYQWQEKVCKTKPKEVTITYNNDVFTIETSSE